MMGRISHRHRTVDLGRFCAEAAALANRRTAALFAAALQ